MKKVRVQSRVKAVNASTYDVDIAQEFKDVKTTVAEKFDRLNAKLDSFKEEISAWKSIFNTKLTELNANMKTVLEQLAQHDFRFTQHDERIKKLENVNIKIDAKKETISEMAKFGWVAAKVLLTVGAVIGAVGGCSWVLKVFAII